MAARLEKLARQYPYMKDVHEDLAKRVRKSGGPEFIIKTALSESPSLREIGSAILHEYNNPDEEVAYRCAGLLVLNTARRLSVNEKNRPKVIRRVGQGGGTYYHVAFEGREVVLSDRELELLDFFSINPNQVFSSEQLGEIFGGYNPHWARENICRLRTRIEEDPAHPTRLVTVGSNRGSHGYMYRRSVAKSVR